MKRVAAQLTRILKIFIPFLMNNNRENYKKDFSRLCSSLRFIALYCHASCNDIHVGGKKQSSRASFYDLLDYCKFTPLSMSKCPVIIYLNL